MNKQSSEIQSWAQSIRQRGLSDAVRLFLNVIEPLGPLGAQALWVIQPLSGILGWKQLTGELAHILEQPGGVDSLRQLLLDDVTDQDEERVSHADNQGHQ